MRKLVFSGLSSFKLLFYWSSRFRFRPVLKFHCNSKFRPIGCVPFPEFQAFHSHFVACRLLKTAHYPINLELFCDTVHCCISWSIFGIRKSMFACRHIFGNDFLFVLEFQRHAKNTLCVHQLHTAGIVSYHCVTFLVCVPKIAVCSDYHITMYARRSY